LSFSNPSHVSQPQQQVAYQQQIQTQPVNLVQIQTQQQQYPARPTVVQQQQKPLHVLVNDPYRQPPTPASQELLNQSLFQQVQPVSDRQ
jgi:hypothetical protein